MAKPILIVEIPRTYGQDIVDKVNEAWSKKLHDWHVIVVNSQLNDKWAFKPISENTQPIIA